MPAGSDSPARRLEVLIIGSALASANLAVELRMRGVRACVVGTEEDFFALIRHAWLRPSIAIVELDIDASARDREVRSRSLIAALAGMPAVLIGAERDDTQWFNDIVDVLPVGAQPDVIVDTIKAFA